jgi:hypothetical protein
MGNSSSSNENSDLGNDARATKVATEEMDVHALLAQHDALVSELRALVCTHPHFKAHQHDGLWLLRYLLSHKLKVPSASKAARAALQQRHDRNLDELAKRTRNTPALQIPHYAELKCFTGTHVWLIHPPRGTGIMSIESEAAERVFVEAFHARGEPLARAEACAHGEDKSFAHYEGGLLDIVLAKDLNMHELWQRRVEIGELMESYHERNFQFIDEATRRSGRIVKMHRIVSLKDFSLQQIHLRFMQWEGQRAAASSDLYPQLLGHQFMLDLPSVLRSIYWNVLRPLLPASVIAKTHVLDTALPADMEQLERHLGPRLQLPAIAGGSSRQPWPWPWADEIPVLGDTQFKRYDEPSFDTRL